jgi:DNA-binding NtrC family response regulator
MHVVLHVGPPPTIEDLGGANGSRVGDRRLRPHERVEVAPGEVIDLGSVMIVVQRGAPAQRPRRVWTHGLFEERLDEECARSGPARSFAVIRIDVAGEVDPAAVEEALGGKLRESDLLASYGPSQYELLLGGVDPDGAPAVVRALGQKLKALGAEVRTGIACHPRDGRTGAALIACAVGGAQSGGKRARRPSVVVKDDAMQRLHRLVERIAPSSISVLLLGETGVGKEVLAEAVHQASPRAGKPLLRLNCGALPEALLESELFGHEKGAFTGAVETKPGLLESADGGTVFLDEVGEMPPPLQVKLLRVLEERRVTRVGGLKPRAIDVRFIAATNRDLEEAAAAGKFRHDLYFRLNGISLVIPPLRERVVEIAELAALFAGEAARCAGRRAVELSPEAIDLLERYSWPGNIRELKNVMERAVVLCQGDEITVENLPVEKMRTLRQESAPSGGPPIDEMSALKGRVRELERQQLLDALARCGGNQSQAAKLLGVSRNTVMARIAEHGLPRPKKRT